MRATLKAVFMTAAVFWSILAAPAAAQPFAFVSATGVDTRPCTVRAQPCKTLKRAIFVVAAGGEITLLSSLPPQNATIAKSLTIDGGGNTMIGTITINSASAIVTLRQLNMNGRGAIGRGIIVVSATAVHIEKVAIERYVNEGIRLAPNLSGEVFVSDAVLRDNANGLAAVAPTTVKLTIDNSLFENNQFNGVSAAGGSTSISRSVSSGSERGFSLSGGSMNVTNSTAAANSVNGFAVFAGQMIIKSSTGRGNVGAGLGVDSGATAVISSSTFTNNADGVLNNGIVYSLEDNVIDGNTANNVAGTALDTTSVDLQ